MTTLYRPVLLESTEQAEALPEGTVAVSEQFAPEAFVKDGDSWLGTHGPGAFTNESAVGLTALVPIEAEENRIAPDAITYTRYVTAWEEA